MARNAFLRVFGQHWLKPLTFWLLALPGLWLGWQWTLLLTAMPHDLGFNPIETTHRFLGDTALRILLITLAVTPFRDLTRWLPIMKVRRRIGLAAFWYAFLHIAAYLGLDLFIAAGMSLAGMLAGLWEDVAERVYITLGMAAFLLLIPLAATSFNATIRLLGPRLWQQVHWAIYPLAIVAVLHHGFMEKGNQPMPWIHGGILAVLLGYRLVRTARRRSQARPVAS
jgi:sulfoxide reductase heme-binding subunit YedZ